MTAGTGIQPSRRSSGRQILSENPLRPAISTVESTSGRIAYIDGARKIGKTLRTARPLGSRDVTIDKSLRGKGRLARARNVLKREERMAVLQADDRWTAGRSPLGLPKVRVVDHSGSAKRRKRRPRKRPILLLPRRRPPLRREQRRVHRRERPQAPPNPQQRQNRLPAKSRDSSVRAPRPSVRSELAQRGIAHVGRRTVAAGRSGAPPVPLPRAMTLARGRTAAPCCEPAADAHRTSSARPRRCDPACAGPP